MKLAQYKFFRKLLKGNWYQNRYFNEKGIKIRWERKEYKLFDTMNVITIKTEVYKKSSQSLGAQKD